MLSAFGAWLRPVERTVRVREVPSSNLGAPTSNHSPPIIGGESFNLDVNVILRNLFSKYEFMKQNSPSLHRQLSNFQESFYFNLLTFPN